MLSLPINKLRGHANKECKHPTLKKVLPCKPEKPYSRINRNKGENQRTEKCQPLQKHQIVRHQIPLTERTSKTTPVGQKNAHFFKPPNSTRTHRTPSKAKKGTSPIVPRNTPLLKIKNQCPPICLAPLYANPTTAPTTQQNTRNFKNMSRATTIRPAPSLSKNQRPCQKCSKRSILCKE